MQNVSPNKQALQLQYNMVVVAMASVNLTDWKAINYMRVIYFWTGHATYYFF